MHDKDEHRQAKHSVPSLYKTRLCRTFIERGTCPYGDKCDFAHGTNDLSYDITKHPKVIVSIAHKLEYVFPSSIGPNFVEVSKRLAAVCMATAAASRTSSPRIPSRLRPLHNLEPPPRRSPEASSCTHKVKTRKRRRSRSERTRATRRPQ